MTMSLEVTWLAGAGFRLVDSQGHVVFIDPWLDAPPGNPGHPLTVADVTRADLVLVTHGDPGHYGRGDGVRIAQNNACAFASSRQLCDYVTGEKLLPLGQVHALPLQEAVDLGPARVVMFPAVHPPWTSPPGYPVPRDPNTGILLVMDGFTVLFAGDCVPGDRVYAAVTASTRPVLALLPTGSPAGSHGTLEATAETAAEIAGMSGARYVIPHYNYVPENPAVAMLATELARRGIELIAARPGEVTRFEATAFPDRLESMPLPLSSPGEPP
jgi:L-ascorbate metabolism protein UlaG (beta-lactamase superfamily)